MAMLLGAIAGNISCLIALIIAMIPVILGLVVIISSKDSEG